MDVYNFTAARFIISTVFLYCLRNPLKGAIDSDISDDKKGNFMKRTVRLIINSALNQLHRGT